MRTGLRPIIVSGLVLLAVAGLAIAETHVYFNTQRSIYHSYSCKWAKRCTLNCVDMPLSEAKQKGRPCKVCNGRP